MIRHDSLIRGSSFVVALAMVLNRVFFLACCVGFTATWIFPGFFTAWIGQSHSAGVVHNILIGMRFEVLLGIAEAIATDRMLMAMAKIVESVGVGDPFILANAQRLRTIGWWLLGLQLLDLPGAFIARFSPYLRGDGSAFSIGGWIAVLMVFVLSRVFAAGAAMRDDLEGTV